MNDVLINEVTLSQVSSALDRIISELESVTARSDVLMDAVDQPFSDGELRGLASDFESRWEVKRTELAGDLESIRDHVQAVIEGFGDLDASAAGGIGASG